MFKVEQLVINPETPEELQKISTDLVGYVIEKSSNKVVNVAVITRRAIPDWYKKSTDKFTFSEHRFAIASICLIGTILGMQVTEVEDKKTDNNDNGSGSKAKYQYHVN